MCEEWPLVAPDERMEKTWRMFLVLLCPRRAHIDR
ncbi:MAG: hypothetical protein JWN62_2959 [Acidimicrobiales bacterium]|nr:hypothetical protein [Acidimicrobiales bacterium]